MRSVYPTPSASPVLASGSSVIQRTMRKGSYTRTGLSCIVESPNQVTPDPPHDVERDDRPGGLLDASLQSYFAMESDSCDVSRGVAILYRLGIPMSDVEMLMQSAVGDVDVETHLKNFSLKDCLYAHFGVQEMENGRMRFSDLGIPSKDVVKLVDGTNEQLG